MPEAKGALALAGPADLDELLAMLARFDASQGYAFVDEIFVEEAARAASRCAR